MDDFVWTVQDSAAAMLSGLTTRELADVGRVADRLAFGFTTNGYKVGEVRIRIDHESGLVLWSMMLDGLLVSGRYDGPSSLGRFA